MGWRKSTVLVVLMVLVVLVVLAAKHHRGAEEESPEALGNGQLSSPQQPVPSTNA